MAKNSFVSTAANGIFDRLRVMSDEELSQVVAHCDSLTTTNCDWREYEIAPFIKGMARSIFLARKINQEIDAEKAALSSTSTPAAPPDEVE